MHSLMGIAIQTADPDAYSEERLNYFRISVKVLSLMATVNRKKCYIPGETIQNERMRVRLITNGGIGIPYYLSKYALSKDIKLFATQHLANDFDNNDYLFQINLIRRFYLNNENDAPIIHHPKHSQNDLRASDSNPIHDQMKLELENKTNNTHNENENGIGVPHLVAGKVYVFIKKELGSLIDQSLPLGTREQPRGR